MNEWRTFYNFSHSQSHKNCETLFAGLFHLIFSAIVLVLISNLYGKMKKTAENCFLNETFTLRTFF